MYGDIIPPKKKYHDPIIEDDHVELGYVESRKSVHFTPISRQRYSEPQSKKLPIFLALCALAVIGVGIYHKIFNGTTISLTPQTTRFEIKQKIPLILQNREKDSLTYSLVYVPEEGETRNPFVATSSEVVDEAITITATSTGDTKKILLINKSTEIVPLRIATRFDVNGTTYTLDKAINLSPSPDSDIERVSTSTPQYKVIGFKGSSSYDTVYAIPLVRPSVASEASSSLPPQDIISLMPKNAIPLEKSTIYDKLLEQSAVVVFDKKVLQEFLQEYTVQLKEYADVLKPFGSSLTYEVAIIDYTLVTSPDTGKPVAFDSLIIDITPAVDTELIPRQFTGFKKETMEKIQKQVSEYITLDVSYTPFWSKSVAEEERVLVK